MAAMRSRSAAGLRILAYHGVQEAPGDVLNFDGFQVAPEAFRAQMEWVARRFTLVSLGEVLRKGRWPEHAVAVTFDDGYLNNFDVAAPFLKAMGLPATFFVTTGFLDGTASPWWYRFRSSVGKRGDNIKEMVLGEVRLKGMGAAEREKELAALAARFAPSDLPALMTWDHARKLIAQGFEVAPHTVTHINLNRETDDVIESEIVESTRRLSAELNVKPSVYSYPYGRPEDISSRAVDTLRRLGYDGAVTTSEGINRPGGDAFRLFRYNVTGNHRGLSFEWLMSRMT